VTAPTLTGATGTKVVLRLLWVNAVVFQLVASADRFTFVWLSDETLQATKGVTGFIVFMLGLPMFLFLLPAGAFADRGRKRFQLLASQAVTAIVSAVAAVLTWRDAMTIPLAIMVATAFGLSFAFAFPVRSSLLPLVVGRERLPKAIPIMTIGMNLAMIAGPRIAGSTIKAFDITGAFITQAAFMVISMVFIARIPFTDAPSIAPRRSLIGEITEGLTYVRRSATLRTLLFLMGVGGGFMMGPSFLLLPIVARTEFGRDASAASLIFAVMGLGMLVVSLLLLRFGRALTRPGLALMVCMLFGTSIAIVMGFAPSFSFLLLLMFMWGLTGGVWANTTQTLLQSHAEPAMLGRVMSLSALVTTGIAPLSALFFGQLAERTTAKHAMGWAGVAGVLCVCGALWFGRELRALRVAPRHLV
jgi:MFS family permease